MSPEDSTAHGYIVSRLHNQYHPTRLSVHSPEDLYRILAPILRDADRECFYGTYLNTKHHCSASN